MFIRFGRFIVLGILLLLLVPGSARSDQCDSCHARDELKVQNKKLFDYFEGFRASVHGLVGLSCSDCHGGDPNSDVAEIAHEDVMSKVRYDRIPVTCGECHEVQRDAFLGSKHYGILEDKGMAPNCVTCHGAMEMDFIFAGRVKSTCEFCHNHQSGTAPEVPDRAEYILNKINIIKGYKSFVALHGGDAEETKAIDAAYAELTSYWHQFDFERVDEATEKLLSELRVAKAEAIRARRK